MPALELLQPLLVLIDTAYWSPCILSMRFQPQTEKTHDSNYVSEHKSPLLNWRYFCEWASVRWCSFCLWKQSNSFMSGKVVFFFFLLTHMCINFYLRWFAAHCHCCRNELVPLSKFVCALVESISRLGWRSSWWKEFSRLCLWQQRRSVCFIFDNDFFFFFFYFVFRLFFFYFINPTVFLHITNVTLIFNYN